MKFKLMSAIGIAGALMWSTHAMAVPITTGQIVDGELDRLVATIGGAAFNDLCGNGGSVSTEECFAASEGVVIDPATPSTKDEPVSVLYNGDLGGIMLLGTPEFYIVKNATGRALFENLGDLSIGVFDTTNPLLSDTGNGPNSFDINLAGSPTTVSHVTQFNDGGTTPPPTPVPEPASVALLGIGFLSLVGFRRRLGKV